MRIDKRKHEDLTGIMVGAGYHLYNGLVTPYVPTVDKFIVPKRRKCSEMWGVGEGNAVSATGEEAHHKDKGDEEEELAPVPNFRFLSALERLEAIFEAIFAGDSPQWILGVSGALALTNLLPPPLSQVGSSRSTRRATQNCVPA